MDAFCTSAPKPAYISEWAAFLPSEPAYRILADPPVGLTVVSCGTLRNLSPARRQQLSTPV